VRRLLAAGYPIFALAIVAIGVELIVCAWMPGKGVFPHGYDAIPVIPFPPPIPWLVVLLGAVVAACGGGLIFPRSARMGALLLGSLFFFCTLVLEVPKAAAYPASMSLRTTVFEPVALGALAWMLPGLTTPARFMVGRWLLAVSLVVFGSDHFMDLDGIGSLVPAWVPWHVFWIGFFGAAFIAAAAAIAIGRLVGPALALLGLMYALWVLTLHLPLTLGLYGIPRTMHDPAEWSSLFIALALWGGPWAIAATRMSGGPSTSSG